MFDFIDREKTACKVRQMCRPLGLREPLLRLRARPNYEDERLRCSSLRFIGSPVVPMAHRGYGPTFISGTVCAAPINELRN